MSEPDQPQPGLSMQAPPGYGEELERDRRYERRLIPKNIAALAAIAALTALRILGS